MKNINNIGATVRDRVIEELRERILTAKIVPGERLDLDSISEEFGVSRTPVREALLALAHDGLAKINPRSCVIVVGLTPADIQDNFALLAMLAGMAAKWASERASEVELLRLRDLAHAVEEAARTDGSVSARNLEFHRHINLSAKSERLLVMLRVARRIVPQTFFDVIPEQVDLSLSEHDDLLSAMLARNGNLARAIAEKHFLAAGKLLAQRHTLLLHLELEGQEHQEAMSTKGAA